MEKDELCTSGMASHTWLDVRQKIVHEATSSSICQKLVMPGPPFQRHKHRRFPHNPASHRATSPLRKHIMVTSSGVVTHAGAFPDLKKIAITIRAGTRIRDAYNFNAPTATGDADCVNCVLLLFFRFPLSTGSRTGVHFNRFRCLQCYRPRFSDVQHHALQSPRQSLPSKGHAKLLRVDLLLLRPLAGQEVCAVISDFVIGLHQASVDVS
eukprot:1619812-Karenia_brevis.AAC.1